MPRRLRYRTSRSRHASHDAKQLLGLHDKLPVIFGHVITEMLLQQVDGLAIELGHEDVFVYYFLRNNVVRDQRHCTRGNVFDTCLRQAVL